MQDEEAPKRRSLDWWTDMVTARTTTPPKSDELAWGRMEHMDQ